MKTYITLKVGYSAGINGCSNEYFTTIVINDTDTIHAFSYRGMYGVEERIAQTLNDLGFEQKYIPSSYGKVSKKNMPSTLFISEAETLKEIAVMYGEDL